MSAVRQFTRPIVTVFLLTITVLGLVNVYGDSSDVVALAQKVACRGISCPTRTTRIERTPFSHEYDLAATLQNGKQTDTVSVTIRCTRAYVLAGDWSCTEKH